MTIVLSSDSSTVSGAGVDNYCDLVERISDWLNRTDLDEQIPLFIRLAESKIRTDFRLRTQETVDTGTLTDGAFDVPALLNEARRLVVTDGVRGDREVDYITPEDFSRRARFPGSFVTSYTLIGTQFRVLFGADEAYALTYWARFAAFAACADTNWLLTNSPDVYLWAALEAGYLFLKDAAAADVCAQRYAAAAAKVQEREDEMRYSGGRLVIPLVSYGP